MNLTVGVDEVGRGPWAGPLVASAVVLPDAYDIEHLADSKSLTSARRQLVLAGIRRQALAIGIGWTPPRYIDKQGLTSATARAMKLALDQIRLTYSGVVIDGAFNYLGHLKNTQAVVGGDKTHPAVAAASIVAKQARDSYMRTMGGLYPEYGFERHVGYGTRDHQTALRQHGPCGLHRLSFKPLTRLRTGGQLAA